MVHLLDYTITKDSHSAKMLYVLKENTIEVVKHIEIPTQPTINQLISIVNDLLYKVLPSDIVVCPWAIPFNQRVNEVFENLSKSCFVVTAAGNSNTEIETYSPASANGVIVVGCLNKSGNKATLSNYSNTKKLVWVTGTNYNINGTIESGSSVSAMLYAAYLAESLRTKNPNLVDQLIEQRKLESLKEVT